jgi:hypothetical protein
MKRFIWIHFILIVFFVQSAFSQNDTTDRPLVATDTLLTDIGLFSSDSLLHLSLLFDINEYIRKKPKDEYLNALGEFVAKKPDLYRVINDFPYLNEKSKKSMLRYLDEFYAGINTNNTIIRNFLNECSSF